MTSQKIEWVARPHLPLLAMALAQIPVICVSTAILLSILFEAVSGRFYLSGYDVFEILMAYIVLAITFYFLARQKLYVMDDTGIYVFPIWSWSGVARPMAGKKMPFTAIKDFEVIPVKSCKGSIIVFHGGKWEHSAAYWGDRISLGGDGIGTGIALGRDKIFASPEFSSDVASRCESIDRAIMLNKKSYSLSELFFRQLLSKDEALYCSDAVLKLVLAGLIEHGVRPRQIKRRRQSPPLTSP